MTITSVKFFLFLIFTVMCYYLFPKKNRWIILLLSSVAFFTILSSFKLFLYVIFSTVVSYIGTLLMDKKCKNERQKRIVLFLTLASILLVLSILKYINIIPLGINVFSSIFNINSPMGTFNFIAPLGISYYSLSLIGYVIDIYRTSYSPQKNIFKLLLYTCFYPALVSGPVMRYNEMENELFEAKKFNWDNIFSGSERIIYGLMKKVLIADQLSLIVTQVFSNYNVYTGYYLILATMLYAIQIYTDFSGCMDIIIGSSKMYGITVKENFKSPFFSKNLSEFWRTWHISLGTWSKDYIMYPLLKSNLFQKLGKSMKRKFGKIGKKIPTILAILILWLLIGLWHGASFKYIFAAGIMPWIYLTMGEILEKPIKKLIEKLKINTECFSYHILCSLKTFFFMCIIWFVACSPSLRLVPTLIKNIFILPLGTLTLPPIPVIPILFACLIVLIVDYLSYKEINVLELFSKQNIYFKWTILLFILFITIIYGAYGPGYNPVDFIYGGF